MFVRKLNSSQVMQTQKDSQSLWSGFTPLEFRVAKLERMLRVYNLESFSMCGLVDEKGDVAASLKWYPTHLAHGEKRIKTFGIGAVFTQESKRKQGFARKLLEEALIAAKAEGYQAALLFSDIEPGYYAKLGFKLFPAPLRSVEVEKLPIDSPLQLRLAKLNELSKMIEWYEDSWQKDNLRTFRTVGEWSLYRERASASPDYVLTEGNQEVGYITLGISGGTLRLEELVVAERAVEKAWASIRMLALAEHIFRIEGWFRPDRVTQTFKTTERTSAFPMVLSLNDHFDVSQVHPEKVHFGVIDHF